MKKISDMKEHIIRLQQAEDLIEHQSSEQDVRQVEELLAEIAEKFTSGSHVEAKNSQEQVPVFDKDIFPEEIPTQEESVRSMKDLLNTSI